MFEEENEKYLYRRQFLLAPRRIDVFKSWKQVQISKEYYLAAHPDLPITQVHYKDRYLYLLGFIIDPYNPFFDDTRIMQNVIEKSDTADDLFINISDKCGRFVIIVKTENEFRIFSDTCGLRQIFYHFTMNKSVWCSSQPHLIAHQLGIEVNEIVKTDLHRTSLFKSVEHWYPGTITLFDKIYHLNPNHYLDIKSCNFVRYWPRERLNPISIEECVPKVLSLLQGIIQGAVNRYNVAFAISSGYDSRTLLAASREFAKNISYFTHANATVVNKDPDILIPSAMLKNLGLKHNILILPEKIDHDFNSLFQKNVFTARTCKGLNAFSIYNHFKKNRNDMVVIYGNCSEITKRDRFRFPKTPKIFLNGKSLAAMAQMSKSDIALKEFEKWVIHAKKLTKYNIDILDLMHWEQRVGNWGAMTLAEYDIVQETLCPYSCRKYIEYMLRVPFKYRTNPDYKLHRKIMASSWPEILEYEINPPENRIKRSIEDLLYWTNLYDPIQFLHIMYYKRFR